MSFALAREKEDRNNLANKLKALEEKLLHGSNNDAADKLAEKNRQQEQELALYEQQLQEKQFLDEERQRKIAELEEAQLMAEVKCNTMEEELEMKSTKLRKLMGCYQQCKVDYSSLQTELQDTIHEFHQERTDLLLALRSLEQQHQLKTLIIEKFIPAEEVSKIMNRVQWDEESESWMLQSMISQMPSHLGGNIPYIVDPWNKQPLQRPGSAIGRSRPTCQQAVEALSRANPDPRYMIDNVLKLELDAHKHKLYDYENHLERAQAQADVMQSLAAFNHPRETYLPFEREATPPVAASKRPRQQPPAFRPRTANR